MNYYAPELYVGRRVHWTDPDADTCSCDGVIADIKSEEEYPIIDEDAMLIVRTDDGDEVMARLWELTLAK